MDSVIIKCKTLEDTKKLAEKFASLVKTHGCFVNLYGEIGAGKTAFVRLVAEALGVKEKVTSPLIRDEDSLFRIYLSDVGMFTYQSGLNYEKFLVDKNNALSGIYYENYVASELIARRRELFYWKGKRNSELEFVIDINGEIVPIDVKKGRDRLESLKEFRAHNKTGLAIKVSSNQYGYNEDKKLLTLPFYYFPFYLDTKLD